jgi:OST-HTH/LOTUS domain
VLKPKPATSVAQLKNDTALVNHLRNAVEAASDDDGWASLASVGHIITKQRPDFDSRNYGYAKLSDLMAATTLFELDRRSPGDGKPAVIYSRDKRRRSDKKPQPTRPESKLTPPVATSAQPDTTGPDDPSNWVWGVMVSP